MGRLLIAVAPDAGLSPAATLDAWTADAVASAAGSAGLETARGEVFFPGLALVLIPLGVNLASSLTYDLVKTLAARLWPDRGDEPRVEQAEVTASPGDLVIVVRAGRPG
jgi:hypothetical protein